MIYSPKTIEEYILNHLESGTINTTELLNRISKRRAGTTKQAFYQALRKLKLEEVVVVRSKNVSLSHLWIHKMSDYFHAVTQNYLNSSENKEDFLVLDDGEKIAYTFNTFNNADIFWGHAFGILTKTTDYKNPVCIYNPHEWFMVAREDSEKKLFEDISKSGRSLFVLAGHNNPIDNEIKKNFDGKFAQYHTLDKALFPKENYYVNIIGEYIIEAYLDEHISQEIDVLYNKYTKIDTSVISELKMITNKKSKNRIVISKNAKKTKKIQSLFRKYFFVIKNT